MTHVFEYLGLEGVVVRVSHPGDGSDLAGVRIQGRDITVSLPQVGPSPDW
jgi:hypothetical protein